jgi:hypothetical protein
MNPKMPIPEGMPTKHVSNKRVISRRRAIRLGIEAAAGVTVGVATTTAWAKPQVASVKLQNGCSASPPPGRPSIEASKDARVVDRIGQKLTVAGTIKIKNVSEVQVIVESLADTVQYRDGNKWKDASTELQSLSGCGIGSCIKPRKQCSGDYRVTAKVPLSAEKFRNRVDVKVMYRNKIFSYTADVEQQLFQVPGEEPSPSPIEFSPGSPSEAPSP